MQVRGAWVREKHPRRKGSANRDPTAPLRGALAYLSCQPSAMSSVAVNRAGFADFKQYQPEPEPPQQTLPKLEIPDIQTHRSKSRAPRSQADRRTVVDVEEDEQNDDYEREESHSHHRHHRRDRDDYERSEYESRHRHGDDYRTSDHHRARDEYSRSGGSRYRRDASPPPASKPRASSATFRPRHTSQAQSALSKQRALSSRWSNATTPLDI